MRRTAAPPAPIAIPRRRWPGGSDLTAIAITTALSPASRISIRIIESTPRKNSVLRCPIVARSPHQNATNRLCLSARGSDTFAVAASALIAFAEGGMRGADLVAPCEVAESLVVGLAARFRRLGGFETSAIDLLVGVEIAAIGGVALLLGAAESDPPVLARCVDRFGAGLIKTLAGRFGVEVVFGLGDEDGAALAQGVLVDVEFVVGDTRDSIFERLSGRGAGDRASESEQAGAEEASSQNGSDAGHAQAGQGGACAKSPSGTERPSDEGSDGDA